MTTGATENSLHSQSLLPEKLFGEFFGDPLLGKAHGAHRHTEIRSQLGLATTVGRTSLHWRGAGGVALPLYLGVLVEGQDVASNQILKNY